MTRLDLVLVVGGLLLLHGAVCVDPPPPPTWPDYTFNSAECENKLSQLQAGLEDTILYATNPGGAVFWSTATDHQDGQPNVNMLAAQDWAAQTGKMTLEMTQGGIALDAKNLFDNNSGYTPAEAAFYWNCASTYFARQASGTLHAFGRKMRLDTPWVNSDGTRVPTFFNIELVEILNNNPNAQIVFHYNFFYSCDL